jgi:hypothetical protein
MKYTFFEISDTSLKYRRNLMLVSVLCIMHFFYISLESLKVFNVEIPLHLLDIGIPAAALWFGLNYFYLITTELLQWRVQFLNLDKDHVVKGAIHRHWESYTVTGEISNLTDKSYSVRTEFSVGGNLDHINTEKAKCDALEKAFKDTLHNFRIGVEHDLERITSFQRSIYRYSLASRLKLFVLDYTVPMLMLLASVAGFAYNIF